MRPPLAPTVGRTGRLRGPDRPFPRATGRRWAHGRRDPLHLRRRPHPLALPRPARGRGALRRPGRVADPRRRRVGRRRDPDLRHLEPRHGDTGRAPRRRVVVGARAAIGDLLAVDPSGVVFGRSATELTFQLARTLWRRTGVRATRSSSAAWTTTPTSGRGCSPPRLAAPRVRWVDFDPATGELAPEAVAGRRHRPHPPRRRHRRVQPHRHPPRPARHRRRSPTTAGALLWVDGVHATAHVLTDVPGERRRLLGLLALQVPRPAPRRPRGLARRCSRPCGPTSCCRRPTPCPSASSSARCPTRCSPARPQPSTSSPTSPLTDRRIRAASGSSPPSPPSRSTRTHSSPRWRSGFARSPASRHTASRSDAPRPLLVTVEGHDPQDLRAGAGRARRQRACRSLLRVGVQPPPRARRDRRAADGPRALHERLGRRPARPRPRGDLRDRPMSRPVPCRPGPARSPSGTTPDRPPSTRATSSSRCTSVASVIASTRASLRVLETSHPPTYYLPAAAFLPGSLVPVEGSTVCEWKGRADYFDVVGGGVRAARAGWHYPSPCRRMPSSPVTSPSCRGWWTGASWTASG